MTPSGLKVKLSVPQGAAPGSVLTFSLPASVGANEQETHAAVLIQARMRGSVARRKFDVGVDTSAILLRAAPDEVKAPDEGKAVTARNDEQEAARLHWMNYYIDQGLFEDAFALSLTPEEEARITRSMKLWSMNFGP